MPDCIIHIDENGKLINRQVLADIFKKLKPDRGYTVAIRQLRKRSSKMNSYYWSCVIPMVKEGLQQVGFEDVKDDEDAHAILKHLFLPKIYKSDKNGDEIVIEGSTTELDNVEFTLFLEKVWQWAAQYLSIVIPAPNQQSEIQY